MGTINFKNIDYLRAGNNKQKRAYDVLTKNKVLFSLKEFNPILIGTIPICIDLENSDLDIACYVTDRNRFEKLLLNKFGSEHSFKLWENTALEAPATIANFFMDGFEIEIFGQNIPTEDQAGYRHMLIEHKLLEQYGEEFRRRIIERKANGHKTEPAFALELGLKGDPYKALLELDVNYQ